MNKAPRILALMAALAAGTAAAAGTPAGTAITNTATATFTDPTTNQPVATPVQSNTVSTVVLAKPNFDIVYRAGADGTAATGALPAGYEGQVLPDGVFETAYNVQNLGNVDSYVVKLQANTTGSPGTPQSVLYYIDANGDGILNATERAAGAVTQVTVPVDQPGTPQDEGVVRIIQVIKVPAAAAAGSAYAASPQGTADVYDSATKTVAPQTEAATDLQYSRAVVYTPSITNNVIDGDNNPRNGRQDPPTTVTPPGQGTAVTGYTDPSRPATNIVAINPDNQVAYPKADADANPDVVTFVNSVTNNGTLNETVNLFPTTKTGAGGLPTGKPDAGGTFTLANGVKVRFLSNTPDANGVYQPLPIGADGYPVLSVSAGQTLNYRTEVTYPDFDSDPASSAAPIVITIGADSGNDAGLEAEDTSSDTVYPAQLQFGDATAALGADPTPAPIQTVVPGAASGTSPSDSTDSSAVFPMDVANTGAYADTYTLTGTVAVPVVNADGTVGSQTVNVRYFAATGAGQPGSELTFTTGAGGTRLYTTGTVQPQSELKVFAVVDIPANAQATTANGVTTPLTVSQSATGVYSTITRADTNDQIAVGQPGNRGVSLTKSEPAAARPGDPLSYTITAKNNFNAALKNFYVTEANSNPSTNVFTWTTFQSVVATKSFTGGTVLYRFNGGTWQASATPGIAASDVTSVDIGVDSNGNGTVDGNDLFPAQGQLNITFNVTIK